MAAVMKEAKRECDTYVSAGTAASHFTDNIFQVKLV
jgi:hypothetical protein